MSFEFYVTIAVTVPLAILANVLTPHFVAFYVRYSDRSRIVTEKRNEARRLRIERAKGDASCAISLYAAAFVRLLFFFLLIIFSLVMLRLSEGMLYASNVALARRYLYGNPFSLELWAEVFSHGGLAAGGAVAFVLGLVMLFVGSYRLAQLITNVSNFAFAAMKQESSPKGKTEQPIAHSKNG